MEVGGRNYEKVVDVLMIGGAFLFIVLTKRIKENFKYYVTLKYSHPPPLPLPFLLDDIRELPYSSYLSPGGLWAKTYLKNCL